MEIYFIHLVCILTCILYDFMHLFLAIPLLVFAIIYPTKGVATVLSAIVGIGDSMAQSGIFPLAGGIHPRCTAAASLGSAIAGLAAGLLRILTKAIFPGDTEESMRLSSSVYFGIAVVILVVCFFAHYFIKKYKDQLVSNPTYIASLFIKMCDANTSYTHCSLHRRWLSSRLNMLKLPIHSYYNLKPLKIAFNLS